jgi:hypothetical protein
MKVKGKIALAKNNHSSTLIMNCLKNNGYMLMWFLSTFSIIFI